MKTIFETLIRFFAPSCVRETKFHNWLDKMFENYDVLAILTNEKSRKIFDDVILDKKRYWRL